MLINSSCCPLPASSKRVTSLFVVLVVDGGAVEHPVQSLQQALQVCLVLCKLLCRAAVI